jgi:hypothetical protein
MKQLVGVWELVAYEIGTEDGAREPLWGGASGRLIYTSDGAVSALITRAQPVGATNEDVIAYAGRYRVSQQEILHEITESTVVRYRGTVVRREYRLSGDTLELVARNLPGGTHFVSWRRVCE